MVGRFREDIASIFERVPAARSTLEVLCCYPGLYAVWLHCIANWLWKRKLFFLDRFISHLGQVT
jgi:serine O-acetyltransferase